MSPQRHVGLFPDVWSPRYHSETAANETLMVVGEGTLHRNDRSETIFAVLTFRKHLATLVLVFGQKSPQVKRKNHHIGKGLLSPDYHHV